MFLLFPKRLCGLLANSRFHHQPDPQPRPDSKLEAAYHKADEALQKILDLLAAAGFHPIKCWSILVYDLRS